MRIALIGLLLIAAPGRAQSPEYHGLTGSILLGTASWKLDDGTSPTDFAGGIAVGYRLRLFSIGESVVSLTPRLSLVITKFTGIKLNSSETGFALLNVPSFQLAARMNGIRPYVVGELGTASIERYVGADLVNFYGSANSFGVGVELPRNNPCGAGFDLAVRWMTGTLSSTEWRGTGAVPSGGDISGAIFTLGWTGAFRGSRLLFACR